MKRHIPILLIALALAIGCSSKPRRIRTVHGPWPVTQPASEPADGEDAPGQPAIEGRTGSATPRPAKVDRRAAWPRTYDQAVTAVLAGMSEDDRDLFASLPKDKAVRLRPDWPRELARKFGLPDNRELLDACAARAASQPASAPAVPGQIRIHPDRAAIMILQGAWESVQPK